MAPKVGTLIQYLVLGILGYVLAGAPLASLLFGSPKERVQQSSVDKAESLVIPEGNLNCPFHGYNVYKISHDPLVLYIRSFLSQEEADHIVRMSESKFTPSTVWTGGIERLAPDVRKSEKALLDRDLTVKCIEERARSFQGWSPNVFIEKLWSQRYTLNGHYRHHYDYNPAVSSSGRISSFMVYLEANCTGGGTNFPRLKVPKEAAWCEFLECEELAGVEGITFKPIKGNAVYWENLRADGSGYKEVWHAGLPVLSGTKIGLNIWSWYQNN
ncbi:hypothetical protein GQ43DRAFT_397153 [Delitschia confertaspora ATCC 74209]|uniref:Prolyl 4-hydroxylase alpha subunit domain-containing protein n=1 Tax=Delitschia confertaspora ATCC 74209 TaxID=1513339 RepID=A0A9P4JPC7_9PLEO|nr:hypothetical protein GQ43DRAFT_397153 [Delitschia confertaspora ATCC 74209]